MTDMTPKNDALIIDKSRIDLTTLNTPCNKTQTKFSNMTTQMTMIEADEGFTSDTNSLRPPQIQDQFNFIRRKRTRTRK